MTVVPTAKITKASKSNNVQLSTSWKAEAISKSILWKLKADEQSTKFTASPAESMLIKFEWTVGSKLSKKTMQQNRN